MVSFAASVKKELTQLQLDQEEARAELSAIIRMNGALQIVEGELSLNIQTENAAITQRIYTLLKTYFQVHGEILVRKKMKLKKNNVYIVRVKQAVDLLLDQLGILGDSSILETVPSAIIANDPTRRAYLRGLFSLGDQ